MATNVFAEADYWNESDRKFQQNLDNLCRKLRDIFRAEWSQVEVEASLESRPDFTNDDNDALDRSALISVQADIELQSGTPLAISDEEWAATKRRSDEAFQASLRHMKSQMAELCAKYLGTAMPKGDAGTSNPSPSLPTHLEIFANHNGIQEPSGPEQIQEPTLQEDPESDDAQELNKEPSWLTPIRDDDDVQLEESEEAVAALFAHPEKLEVVDDVKKQAAEVSPMGSDIPEFTDGEGDSVEVGFDSPSKLETDDDDECEVWYDSPEKFESDFYPNCDGVDDAKAVDDADDKFNEAGLFLDSASVTVVVALPDIDKASPRSPQFSATEWDEAQPDGHNSGSHANKGDHNSDFQYPVLPAKILEDTVALFTFLWDPGGVVERHMFDATQEGNEFHSLQLCGRIPGQGVCHPPQVFDKIPSPFVAVCKFMSRTYAYNGISVTKSTCATYILNCSTGFKGSMNFTPYQPTKDAVIKDDFFSVEEMECKGTALTTSGKRFNMWRTSQNFCKFWCQKWAITFFGYMCFSLISGDIQIAKCPRSRLDIARGRVTQSWIPRAATQGLELLF